MSVPAKRRSRSLLILAAILLVLCIVGAITLTHILELRRYKLDYKELIAEYSAEYEIDPYLVAAVIHCESSGRADAVSKSGAIGLMQIMPETGEWIAEKLGMKKFKSEKLTDPEVSIRMGCWYLEFLMERFSSNVVNVLAAYNAGHGNVDKWLEDGGLSEDGQLKNIPFEETDAYVEKVLYAYEKYQALYPDAFQAGD
ncbi:MAG: lytic transglycosylase domain-containing protein [Bacillota bacterium]